MPPDETDVSQHEESLPDPSLAGAEQAEGDASDGSDASSARPPAVWSKLGYGSPDELEQTHTRYRQQISTSQQETQRLREEADRYRREADEWRTRAAQPPPGRQEPAQAALTDALTAWVQNGDNEAITRWQTEHDKAIEQKLRQELQQGIPEYLMKAVKPNQITEAVLSEFPDLGDRNSPLYKALWDAYPQEAALPYWKLYLQEDPAAIQPAHSPDGTRTQQVDMRIVHALANKLRGQAARDEGRRQEGERRAAANGSSTGPSRGGSGNAEPTAWGLMTAAEQAEIRNMIATRNIPDEWPKTPEAIAKKLTESWKKRYPERIKARTEQYRAGVPISAH